MNFLKMKTSWSTMELGLIKICVGSLYIIIGTYFHEFLQKYLIAFGILFIITAAWAWRLWLIKIKPENQVKN